VGGAGCEVGKIVGVAEELVARDGCGIWASGTRTTRTEDGRLRGAGRWDVTGLHAAGMPPVRRGQGAIAPLVRARAAAARGHIDAERSCASATRDVPVLFSSGARMAWRKHGVDLAAVSGGRFEEARAPITLRGKKVYYGKKETIALLCLTAVGCRHTLWGFFVYEIPGGKIFDEHTYPHARIVHYGGNAASGKAGGNNVHQSNSSQFVDTPGG